MDAATKIGNHADQIVIAAQTLNLGDGPTWLQQIDLPTLHAARERLLTTSRRHENRAWLPPLLVLSTYSLTVWLFTQLGAAAQHLTSTDHIALAILALPLAFFVGFMSWDIRRRDRQIVRVAERRLAEVMVEIALRTPPPTPARWNVHRRRADVTV